MLPRTRAKSIVHPTAGRARLLAMVAAGCLVGWVFAQTGVSFVERGMAPLAISEDTAVPPESSRLGPVLDPGVSVPSCEQAQALPIENLEAASEASPPETDGRRSGCGMLVYDNTGPLAYYAATGAGARIADDCWLIGGNRGVCEVSSLVYNAGSAGNTIRLELWDGCPQGGGHLLFTSPVFALPQYSSTVTWSLSPQVPVGNTVWVAWTSPQAGVGPRISGTADVGYTANRFATDSCGGGGPSCNCVFSGLYSGLDVRISATATPSACCLPDDTCLDLLEAECAAAGGEWYAGAYCVSFVCPPECPPDTLFGQPPVVPTDFWNAYTSDSASGYLVYDNFAGLASSICDLHFWGMQGHWDDVNGWTECPFEDPLEFTITFYGNSDANQPEVDPTRTYVVTLNGTDTGLVYQGALDWHLYEYSAVLNPCYSFAEGWVSIQRTSDPNSPPECRFIWMNGYGLGDGGYQRYSDNSMHAIGDDMALCLTSASLDLVPDAYCYDPNEIVTVSIRMSDIPQAIRGGQFFLSYDTSKLTFVSADAGDAPFTREIYEAVNSGAGTIDYAVGVPDGASGTSADTVMARLHFTPAAGVCHAANLVTFRSHSPPTRLSGDHGGEVLPTTYALSTIAIDGTAPVVGVVTVTGGDVDAGCEKTVTFSATVTDNCCVDVDDVDVAVVVATGNATLGMPSITKTQTNASTVSVTGSVVVSDLTGCPATVQVTVSAQDCCANAATPGVGSANVQDVTPPVITCPGPATVECDELGILLGAANGGVLVMYNNHGPETPGNQAWFRAQFSPTNPNGAALNFDDTPIFGGPSWYDVFQVHPDQFGLDFTLPAPTYNGSNPPLAWFQAKDNVNGTCAGATDGGPVTWAISGYIPSPIDLGGCVVNSVLRSNGLEPGSVVITSWNVTPPSSGGTIWTADVAGYLVSDGLIHWYTPSTPHSPTNNLGMTGTYWFAGTLTYDSLGDPGNDGDFYAGAVALYANSLSTTWGEATATDNCDLAPTITYTDVFTPSACGYTGTITRTWRAADDCNNAVTCNQTITVVDNTPPVISGCPANIVVSNDPNECGAVVSWIAPTATDNCSSTTTVVQTGGLPPGSFFAVGGPYPIAYTAADLCGNSSICTFTITVNDTQNPTITCPPNITTNADAGECTAYVTVPAPVVGDNCAVASVVNDFTGTSDASGVYPIGTTTVTWTVTDIHGNLAHCSHTITVIGSNELRVSVQLSPAMFIGTVSRCITFELWNCGPPVVGPVEVQQELTFTRATAGDPMVASNQVVSVPCGSYNCITARDELHTLRRTAAIADAGTYYTADFTGADELIGGNLNDDNWIDILDFGVFSSQWSVNYGSGDTTCSTPFPHADISGNGLVWTEDFSFIQVNFLRSHEVNCCGQPGLLGSDGGDGPITSIRVSELIERGLDHLALADLNGDGVLDEADVSAFLMGARPLPGPERQDVDAKEPGPEPARQAPVPSRE